MKLSVKPHIRMAAISNEGLSLIAFLVVVLWYLVVTNHLIVRHADAESSHALRELQSLRLRRGARHGEAPEKTPSVVDASVVRAVSIPI